MFVNDQRVSANWRDATRDNACTYIERHRESDCSKLSDEMISEMGQYFETKGKLRNVTDAAVLTSTLESMSFDFCNQALCCPAMQQPTNKDGKSDSSSAPAPTASLASAVTGDMRLAASAADGTKKRKHKGKRKKKKAADAGESNQGETAPTAAVESSPDTTGAEGIAAGASNPDDSVELPANDITRALNLKQQQAAVARDRIELDGDRKLFNKERQQVQTVTLRQDAREARLKEWEQELKDREKDILTGVFKETAQKKAERRMEMELAVEKEQMELKKQEEADKAEEEKDAKDAKNDKEGLKDPPTPEEAKQKNYDNKEKVRAEKAKERKQRKSEREKKAAELEKAKKENDSKDAAMGLNKSEKKEGESNTTPIKPSFQEVRQDAGNNDESNNADNDDNGESGDDESGSGSGSGNGDESEEQEQQS